MKSFIISTTYFRKFVVRAKYAFEAELKVPLEKGEMICLVIVGCFPGEVEKAIESGAKLI